MSEENIKVDQCVVETDREENFRKVKLVYLSDLYDLLRENLDQFTGGIEDNHDFFYCQICAGYVDDYDCNCVKSKKTRIDGEKNHFGTSVTIDLEDICKKIILNASKVVELLRGKGFCCTCPPVPYKFKKGHFGNE